MEHVDLDEIVQALAWFATVNTVDTFQSRFHILCEPACEGFQALAGHELDDKCVHKIVHAMLRLNIGTWKRSTRESRVVSCEEPLKVLWHAECGAHKLPIRSIGKLGGASEERADMIRLSQVDNIHDHEPKTERDTIEPLPALC